MDASDRGMLLHRLADLMERDANYLAVSKLRCRKDDYYILFLIITHINSKQIFVETKKNVCLI